MLDGRGLRHKYFSPQNHLASPLYKCSGFADSAFLQPNHMFSWLKAYAIACRLARFGIDRARLGASFPRFPAVWYGIGH